MENDVLRAQAQRTAPQIKLAGGIWVAAWAIILAASVIWVMLAFLAGDYYSNSKAVRDGAEAGSALLAQLRNLQALKAWLLPFSFLGVVTFLLGFGFAFANILRNVRLRGDTMAAALPQIKRPAPRG